MTRWFRLYDETLNDPKILKLPDSLFRIWVGLLCVASKNDGRLPSIDDTAIMLRSTPLKIAAAVNKLVETGLIDMSDEGLCPHNWDKRQFKSDTSTERVKRFRNVTSTVSETPPETEQIQITDTEQKQSKKEPREVALLSEFETFWFHWPNKVGKPAALKAFQSALRRGPLFAIMTGVDNYIRDKPPDRNWLNPATFLNQNRWEDQPAKVQNGKTSNVLQAVNNLTGILDSFERGATETEAIRGPEGATVVRLISQR